MEFFKLPPLFLLLLGSFGSLAGGQSSTSNQTNDEQQQALLDFKSRITSDPFGILTSWNGDSSSSSSSSSLHFCKWAGVMCDVGNQRVIELDLSSQLLQGSISPSIANLSSLQELWLQNNSFSGEIPSGIGRLRSLRMISLHYNLLTGGIPPNISGCSNLTALDLGGNRLVGKIPDSIGRISKLWFLNLDNNNLTGAIPSSLGNISTLEEIAATSNNLEGTIPESFGRLKKLSFLSIGGSLLNGTIPNSIYNISSLRVLCFPENQLQGTIPPDIGNLLPNLVQFSVGDNQFTGTIPASLSNATNLERFTIALNRISGNMPSMEKLRKLLWLSISANLLGTGKAGDLDFLSTFTNLSSLQLVSLSNNNFGGSLPESVVNFTELSILAMFGNKISGRIPVGMANLKKLEWLDLGNNQFTGSIPEELGTLRNLKKLDLQGNKFSEGRIPSSFGNLSKLTHLYMQQSYIQGTIPPSLGNCRNLLSLNLDRNNLAGEIPEEILSVSSLTIYLGLARNRLTGSLTRQVGTLTNLGVLNVAHNLLSGEIPASLGSCVRLETLLLQNNSFQGVIPSSLSSLKGIQVLNFADNNLTGEIPEFIGSFQSLTTLNLSFNRFHGRVPNEGLFRNSTAASVAGNGELCGGIPELQLPNCSKLEEKSSKAKRFSTGEKAMIIAASSFVLLALFLSPLFLLCIKRKKRVEPNEEEASPNRLPQMTYHSLRKATEEFSPRNLVGTGSFGCVYKGVDPGDDKKFIAVKVLNLLHPAASKSFRAECEVLKAVRHRNLVKLLTLCSSVDAKGNEFKALVYEFMANGSLDEWLHHDPEFETPGRPRLSLLQRLDIAIDVASALEYLHQDLKTSIVHCDLKPSNVLLNHEMTALVGDFGLARLFPEATANLSSSLSSSFGVRGTIGYTAPEYGMGNEVSRSGDVYSYGMLLLEMFTGKRPTNEMFKDGLNLHSHANVGSWKEARAILDAVLVEEIEGTSLSIATSTTVQDCVLSILLLGVAASIESPGERLRISDLAVQLFGIREKLAEDW